MLGLQVVFLDLYWFLLHRMILLPYSLSHGFLIQVLPNMASVMDIKAVSYDVCGVVRMVGTGLKAKVKPHILTSFSCFICTLKVLILHLWPVGSFDSWTRECKTSSETDRCKWKVLLWGITYNDTKYLCFLCLFIFL